MKKVCILMILLSFLLCGCNQIGYELPLCQEIDQITEIELNEHTSGKKVVLRTLNPTEVLPFMEKLNEVSCYRYFNDPSTDNYYLSVSVYYENGDIDLLGTGICDTTCDSMKWRSWYYLDRNETWDLFSDYIPVEQLPPKDWNSWNRIQEDSSVVPSDTVPKDR